MPLWKIPTTAILQRHSSKILEASLIYRDTITLFFYLFLSILSILYFRFFLRAVMMAGKIKIISTAK